MNIHIKYTNFILSAGIFACGASLATAQDVAGTVGLQIGANNASEYDDTSPEDTTVGTAVLNGTVVYTPAGNMTYAADLYARFDDFANGDPGDFTDDEDPEMRWQLGLQALRSVSDVTKIGGFLSYGSQQSQGSPAEDDYNVVLVGLTGQVALSDQFMGYGQFGFGNTTEGEDEGEGFVDGYIGRAGLVYFASATTAINADLQMAGTPTYIDNDDAGIFTSFELSGETQISAKMPVSMEYGVRRSIINSTDEGDHVGETEVFVGVNYSFGHASLADKWRNGVVYGTPDLPSRASAWTEWAD